MCSFLKKYSHNQGGGVQPPLILVPKIQGGGGGCDLPNPPTLAPLLVTVLRTDHRYAVMSYDSSLVSYNAIMHHYLQLIPPGMLQCRHILIYTLALDTKILSVV